MIGASRGTLGEGDRTMYRSNMRPSRMRLYDPQPLPEPHWYWVAAMRAIVVIVLGLMFAGIAGVA